MAATENNQSEQKFRSLFDLPSDFFDSCRFLFDYPLSSSTDAPYPSHLLVSDAAVLVIESTAVGDEPYTKFPEEKQEKVKGATQQWTCNTCKSVFESLQDQRSHFKSDLHRLNIKLGCAGKSIVKEEEFDEQGCDSFFENLEVSSISGSEDEFEKGAVTSAKTLEGTKQKLYLRLHSGGIVSVWKSLILDESEKVSLDDCMPNQLRNDGNALILGENELITKLKCLLSESRDKSCLRIVLLLSGGHFAGCVFDGNSVITHKTFHRYVVRAKAGKKQSTKDATGKSAHSAGSSLRRHNEAALKKDIQDLLAAWKPYINSSSCIYIYAPSKNRQILFDGEKQHLFFHDRVTRHIPLTVRRPTLKEAKRIYHCLTQVSLETDERGSLLAELNSHYGDEEGKRSHLFYESQVIQHLEDKTVPPLSDSPVESEVEHLPPDLANISSFHFENRITPLHAAAQSGNAQLTLELLKCGCSPCLKDDRGRTPYMLAKEKEVRNTFRRFMAANLDRWDWQAAHVPSSLTKEMEESQATKQVEKDAKRKAKVKELKKLRKAKEKAKEQQQETLFGNVVTVDLPHQTFVRTAPSKQLPSDIRIRSSEGTTSTAPLILPKPNSGAILKEDALAIEREKRAAAAERRIEAMKNRGSTIVTVQSDSFDAKGLAKDLLCSYCNSSLVGKIPFHRYHYKYCSTSCMHVHREVLEEG